MQKYSSMQTWAYNKQGHTSKDFKLEKQYDVLCIFVNIMQIEATNTQYIEATFKYICASYLIRLKII